MRDASSGISLVQLLRRLGVCTLAVATICVTFPASAAPTTDADAQKILLAQAYYAPGYYPPPPPPGYRRGPPNAGEFQRGDFDGRADATITISGVLWFAAGFFLTFVGIALGYLLTPSPDGARLVGRSPGYVEGYMNGYGSAGRAIQGIHAVYGCVTSGAIFLVIWILDYAFVGRFWFF